MPNKVFCQSLSNVMRARKENVQGAYNALLSDAFIVYQKLWQLAMQCGNREFVGCAKMANAQEASRFSAQASHQVAQASHQQAANQQEASRFFAQSSHQQGQEASHQVSAQSSHQQQRWKSESPNSVNSENTRSHFEDKSTFYRGSSSNSIRESDATKSKNPISFSFPASTASSSGSMAKHDSVQQTWHKTNVLRNDESTIQRQSQKTGTNAANTEGIRIGGQQETNNYSLEHYEEQERRRKQEKEAEKARRRIIKIRKNYRTKPYVLENPERRAAFENTSRQVPRHNGTHQVASSTQTLQKSDQQSSNEPNRMGKKGELCETCQSVGKSVETAGKVAALVENRPMVSSSSTNGEFNNRPAVSSIPLPPEIWRKPTQPENIHKELKEKLGTDYRGEQQWTTEQATANQFYSNRDRGYQYPQITTILLLNIAVWTLMLRCLILRVRT